MQKEIGMKRLHKKEFVRDNVTVVYTYLGNKEYEKKAIIEKENKVIVICLTRKKDNFTKNAFICNMGEGEPDKQITKLQNINNLNFKEALTYALLQIQ